MVVAVVVPARAIQVEHLAHPNPAGPRQARPHRRWVPQAPQTAPAPTVSPSVSARLPPPVPRLQLRQLESRRAPKAVQWVWDVTEHAMVRPWRTPRAPVKTQARP